MHIRFSIFALFLISLSACETEVDLTAPYESYTTVYGILDLSADTQFVRINKSFLGPGSALDFAQVKDSSEYPIDAVEAYITTGNDTFPLHPIDIPNREPGAFYDEDIRVYITTENLSIDNQGNEINVNSQFNQLADNYKLVVNVNGKTVYANTIATYLRESASITDPNPNIPELVWASPYNNYVPKKFKMEPVPVGYRYEAKVIFHYDDHYTNDEVISRSVEFDVYGSDIAPSGSDGFEADYFPEDIMTTVAESADCGEVAYRVLKPAEFVMMVAGEELTRYLNINSPVTGVVTERPEYSNIEGENALGIFSSRYILSLFKEFNNATKQTIVEGDLTGNLCFCVEGSSTFECPDGDVPCDCD